MRLCAAVSVLLLFSGSSFGQIKVGSPAADISLDFLLPNQPPENARLQALGGKAVVIEFWATWCAPCIIAIPHMNELIDQFQGRPVQFLSVTDEEQAVVEGFLKKKSIGGWVGLDRKGLMKKAYGFDGIPTTVLIDANGKLAGVGHPSQITSAVIEDLLAGRALSLRAGNSMTVSRGGKESGSPPLLDILIRPSTTGDMGFRNVGSTLEMKGSNLRTLLSVAYGVPATRIDGAELDDSLRYDALVSGPKGLDWRSVFRSSVLTAFQLSATTESRETEVLILKAPNGKPESLKATASSHGGSSSTGGKGRMIWVNGAMNEVASTIQGALGRAVVDETGIKDRFDLELKWDASRPESLLDVIRALGLAVEEGRRPLQYLVVKKNMAQ